MAKENKEKQIEEISGDDVVVAYPLFQEEGGGSIPTSPLQFEVVRIKPQLACVLNKTWHSRLPEIHWSNVVRNTHSICFAAIYKNKYYAVGIWSSPVAQNRFQDGKQILELRRLAISPNAPKYTATRIISIMVKIIKKELPDIKRLISYQDTQVHTGTIYKASNWIKEKETDFISWTTEKRQRNVDQAKASKIRWGYLI